MSKLLVESDYAEAATSLGCDVAAIKAVCEVEAPQGGFHADGATPRILFEAHHFHRLTGGRFTASHPNISSAKWNRALYVGGAGEHKRLQEAVALDRDAALQSASWGKFQIMGFNYELAGYPTVQEFVNAVYAGEREQLQGFVTFLGNTGLTAALREHRWMDFARGYNGAGYAANQYDTKLAAAWLRHNKEVA